MKKIKLTSAANHLLNEIASGRDRIFYMTDKPNGWVHLEKNGLAIRHPDYNDKALLTESGRAFWLGQV